ncbi:MAG: glutamine synthetase III [Myxococcales bacterium]|nr:glutamine synthetase III [Myxococcales bacterium]
MANYLFHEGPQQTVSLPEALGNINAKVLDDRTLRSLVDPAVYMEFDSCRKNGGRMGKAGANAVAKSIREWAQERGCVSYSHWFSPVRGPHHGQKLETFIALDFSTGKLMVDLSGFELFQTETDGSSFPNGGLRQTHEAAAYMGWDTASPPFIYGQTLVIPAAFVSWTGEALDQKTPLLRSNDAINTQALRLLRHLGDSDSAKVVTNVGWEQEFFLVDRNTFLERPDLVSVGRALVGGKPLKGQELSQNYFGRMPVRVRKYLDEVRDTLWELGVSIDCSHNEVAPGQFEMSPIFSLTNLAADGNILTMDVLRDLAFKHDFEVLFHEKPFAGINGSGKHNNWGLNTDTGANLFVPGKTPAENRRFVAFVAALLRTIDKHGDLLRIGVSTAGNDHRLGAQEAPPAIITLALGKALEAHMKSVADGGSIEGYGDDNKYIEVATTVPAIKANFEDRNRTAPFPWCGNRFEFRAVGGNQHIAFPLTMVHAGMADSLRHMADQIDAGASVDDVIRGTIKTHVGGLFSGNGYSQDLYDHAERHGLFHLRTSVDAYVQLAADKNIALFEEQGIFTPNEVRARREVLLEAFTTHVQMEARTLLSMLQTGILPAVVEDYQAASGAGFKSLALEHKRDLIQRLHDAVDALISAVDGANDDDTVAAATHAQEKLKPAIFAAGKLATELETVTDVRAWPYPTYDELLHSYQ